MYFEFRVGKEIFRINDVVLYFLRQRESVLVLKLRDLLKEDSCSIIVMICDDTVIKFLFWIYRGLNYFF